MSRASPTDRWAPGGTPSAAAAATRCRHEAQAWWGPELVARSARCWRVDLPGGPELYFPASDIRLGSFVQEEGPWPHRSGIDAYRWSACTATTWRGAPAADGDAPASGPDEGRGVLWTFDAGPPGLPQLADHGAFDHSRMRVELRDTVGDDDPRATTTKRFPNWGDAADLVGLLDVAGDGPRHFVGPGYPDEHRPVVEGSQMLGQAMVAAARLAPGRRAVSSHLVFLRPADARQPLHFDLEELSNGRTLTTLGVRVHQGDRPCAAGTLLLDATAPDVVRHAADAPPVPAPLECPPVDMGVTGRDVRVVDGAYDGDPDAPEGPPVLDSWVRFTGLPDDPALHAGLLAQFTGHLSIAAALRPHPGIGQDQAHRTLSTAINAIDLSLHRPVQADRWMLYHHRSTFAGDGMTHAECRVFDEDGSLVASFNVEAMVRAFAPGSAPADHRRTL